MEDIKKAAAEASAAAEQFAVYQISKKARMIVKQGSRTITIRKRVNPVAEAEMRINGDELAVIFHIIGLQKLTGEALATLQSKMTNTGGENAND